MQYKTERGITIEIVPIPLLLDKVRAAHPEPPPVTYTEHLAGGATQEVEISERDAAMWQKENPESWAEHAEKWAAYQKALAERNQRVNDAIWKAILRKSINVELPADSEWEYFQEELGIDVPPRGTPEYKDAYIWTECIGGTKDIIRITAIANGADVSEEALDVAEASFRGQLQRQASRRLAHQAGTVEAGG